MPKILHIPYTYFPDSSGGTEVYVMDLCAELARLGHTNIIAAPSDSSKSYEFEGVCVHRFEKANQATPEVLYGGGDAVAAKNFLKILDQEKPDIVHFHAYSPAVSHLCVEAARQQGCAVLYTYHTPTMTCARGTLLHLGKFHCDGRIQPWRCAACTMQSHGLPVPLAHLAVGLSLFTGSVVRKGGFRWRSYELIQKRSFAARKWLHAMDKVVALCHWGKDVLLRNEVLPSKIELVRHGVPQLKVCEPRTSNDSNSVKLAFFGRADPTKGLDLLLQALKNNKNLALELDLYTLLANEPNAYESSIHKLCESDRRVRILPPVRRHEVIEKMKAYDAIVVPSIWFETGPLVVLEAFSVGLPVLGSGWGGISEWVTHGENGLLCEEPTPEAWAALLKEFSTNAAMRETLRSKILPPRTHADVASEMHTIYKQLLRKKAECVHA